MWELLTTYWNDAVFIPTFEVISDFHSDFGEKEVHSHDLISNLSPETLEKCKEKIKLMIAIRLYHHKLGEKLSRG